MQTIPLQQTPAQVFDITLDGQLCTLRLHQRSTGLFCDIYIDGNLIIAGQICLNNNPIANYGYLAFRGRLVFIDTQGTSDPDYALFNDRFVLCYLSEGELP